MKNYPTSMKALLPLLLLATFPLFSSASDFPVQDGNWMMPVLAATIKMSEDQSHTPSDEMMVQQAYAFGLIRGVTSTAEIVKGFAEQQNEDDSSIGFAIPKGTNTAQLVRVTYNFLTANPKWLNLPAEKCIFLALSSEYGFKKK